MCCKTICAKLPLQLQKIIDANPYLSKLHILHWKGGGGIPGHVNNNKIHGLSRFSFEIDSCLDRNKTTNVSILKEICKGV